MRRFVIFEESQKDMKGMRPTRLRYFIGFKKKTQKKNVRVDGSGQKCVFYLYFVNVSGEVTEHTP